MIDPLTGKAMEEASKVLPDLYKDLAQPATRELGTALGRAVHMALAPVRGVAWTWEHAEAWLERSVEERFMRLGVSEERIVTPAPQLAAGAIRGVQAAGADPDSSLRDSFANLLATAMDAERTSLAHPAFAEVLSQLTASEARAIQSLAKREFLIPLIWQLVIRRGIRFEHHLVLAKELGWEPQDLSAPYLGNLTRLGIVKSQAGVWARDSDVRDVGIGNVATPWMTLREALRRYDSAHVHETLDRFEHLSRNAEPSQPVSLIYVTVTPTPFGAQMLRAIMDPLEYQNAQFVSIAKWETHPEVLDLK